MKPTNINLFAFLRKDPHIPSGIMSVPEAFFLPLPPATTPCHRDNSDGMRKEASGERWLMKFDLP